MSSEASLRNWMPAIHAGMTRSTLFILWSTPKLIMTCLNSFSPCDQKQPGRSQHQEHKQAKPCGQKAEPVKLALGQVVAADEDNVLAASLRSDGREVAAGEQQRKRHQRCGNTGAHGDVEEHTKERKDVRRLAYEHIVHQHVEYHQNDVGDRPG